MYSARNCPARCCEYYLIQFAGTSQQLDLGRLAGSSALLMRAKGRAASVCRGGMQHCITAAPMTHSPSRRTPQHLHRKLASLGAVRGMSIVTGISITLSMGAVALIVPPESPILLPSLIVAFVIPVLIAPLMSGLIFGLIEELEVALRDLDRLAATDELTQLLNRREFLTRSKAAVDRLRVNGQPCAAILFDLDKFKAINDGAGHATGDYVLQRVGQLCGAVLRPGDLLARYGGDEFVVLLPNADAAQAAALAEAMSQAVRANPPMQGVSTPLRPTITLGVAVSALSREEMPAMLAAADAALLEAKRAGRDRVHVVQL